MGPKKGKRNTKKSRSKSKQKEKKHSRKSESKGRKSRGKGHENEEIENEKRLEFEEEDEPQTDDDFEDEEDEERPHKQRVKKQGRGRGRGRVGSKQETVDEFEDEEDEDESPPKKQGRGRVGSKESKSKKNEKLKHTSSSDSALDFWGNDSQNGKTDRKPKTPPRSESTLSTRYALNHPKTGQTIADRNARFESRPTASPSRPLSGSQKSRVSLHEILDRPPLDLENLYVRPQSQSAFQQQKSSVYGSRNIPVYHQRSGQNHGFVADDMYGRRSRTPEPQYSGSSNLGQPKQFAVNRNQYSKRPNFSYGQRPKSWQSSNHYWD